MNKTVSIVICTYNRAPFLRRTLYSLKKLNYRNFEIVVINGPSTDETEEVLAAYEGKIKVGQNPETNLSISRNMGISLASGEIVAFIDDDAIPDSMWLDDIVSMYDDVTVGGAGGRVFGPGDDHFQFEDGYVDYWGYADVHQINSDFNDKNGEKYNMMLGTNCTFLRRVLLEVGGFDEYYDYFHDESDLCLRVVRAGYAIKNHERAYIHHEYAKSHIRESTFDGYRLNWYPIMKNKAYFAIKNAQGKASDAEIKKKLEQIEREQLADYKTWYTNGAITKAELDKFSNLCKSGFSKGSEDGWNSPRGLNYSLSETSHPFMPADFSQEGLPLSICLLCRDNIIGAVGGVAKYTFELATQLVKAGQIVHVVTEGRETMDWMLNGIGFHSIVPQNMLPLPALTGKQTTSENLQYSYQVYRRLLCLQEKYGLDIVESPLWNFEGAVAAHMTSRNFRLVVRLQTPLLKVCETQAWPITEDLALFSDFERTMMLEADGIISISEHIKETIHDMYHIDFNTPLTTSFIGVSTDNMASRSRSGSEDEIQIFFVGRLERRKGLANLIQIIPRIMEKYPNVRFKLAGDDSIVDNTLGTTFKNAFLKDNHNAKWLKQVEFLGKISDEEKEQCFADCDIFVSPSLYESFGIIFVEAMRYGKPVIGCKCGGMQEVIGDGVNGFLVEVDNDSSLFGALEQLILDKVLRERMGREGLARFRDRFTCERMAEETLAFYHETKKTITHETYQ